MRDDGSDVTQAGEAGAANVLGDTASAAALELLSQAVTLATAVRDEAGQAVDMRVAYMNAAARAGQPDRAGAIGRLCSELWPHMLANGSFAACLRVLDTGVAESGRLRWSEPETYQPGVYTYHASRMGPDTLLWELREGSVDLARAEVLTAVTAALSSVDTTAGVIDALMLHGVAGVGASSGGAVVPDVSGNHFVVLSSLNRPGGTPDRFAFDVGAPLPMAYTARTGRPLFFGDATARAAAFPEAERYFTGSAAATAVLPLTVQDRLLGAVSFHFPTVHAFDAAERAFLSTLTGQFAQALERTRHRDASARAYAQLEMLAGLSDRLAEAADTPAVFSALLAEVVPRLANGATIHLAGEPGTHPHLAASAHVDGGRLAALHTLLDRYPPLADSPTGIGRVLRTGEPELVTDPAAAFDGLARSAHHRAVLGDLATTSWLVVAMEQAGERIGALTLIREGDEPFTDRDVPFAGELGRRVAAAVQHVQTFNRQRNVAHLLQQGLLPRELPAVAGLQFGSCYHSGEHGAEAGGDFYDVFAAAEGRVAVTIGDICGTGPVAASRTALVRHSTRAFGKLLPDIGQVMAAVNTALLEDAPYGKFCTQAYAVLDVDARPVVMSLALAGHPLPFVRRADGRVEALGTPGLVLGIVARPTHTVTRHELHPGDTIVLYTDGATERRNGQTLLGEARLRELIAEAPVGDVPGLVHFLETKITEYSDQPLADDLAILAVQIT
ncbi:hypothetical protein GCM10018962_75420 [Dactylosporangium matsuzakiense]|uniref:Serine phosphatase RsbU (Regulator of sigma subunit) n=1 Tax=Dactylosporangium matsuzakiense TaxID=53360 RepID=A0A9W6NSN3_9ACTN|nr:hypothetical protein GCM10017581_094020 [Dactylosporangium matsuzakiense]